MEQHWLVTPAEIFPGFLTTSRSPGVATVISPHTRLMELGKKTRATPTTKAGSISRIKTFCNWVKSPTSNRLSKPRSETHVDEECVRGVKSEEVHGTRYPDPSQEGPRMGCWGYSKNRTSVLIKRLLTTSFSVLCKQQQKAFIILAFLKLRNILKPL